MANTTNNDTISQAPKPCHLGFSQINDNSIHFPPIDSKFSSKNF
jgi:hypothetical protein